MLEVKFYDTVDDSLLKFAVIIYRAMVNGYFANIRSEIPMRLREVIAKLEKIFGKLLKENFRKKQVLSGLILCQYAFIPLRVRIV